jgi:hypothetical protein
MGASPPILVPTRFSARLAERPRLRNQKPVNSVTLANAHIASPARTSGAQSMRVLAGRDDLNHRSVGPGKQAAVPAAVILFGKQSVAGEADV